MLYLNGLWIAIILRLAFPIFYEELSHIWNIGLLSIQSNGYWCMTLLKLRHQKKWEQEGCFEEIKTQYENVWKGIE